VDVGLFDLSREELVPDDEHRGGLRRIHDLDNKP
jgi:hypothetical protein